MPTRSKATDSSVVSTLFKSPPNKSLKVPVPDISPPFQKIIERAFSIDVEATYAELEAALNSAEDSLKPGELRRQLAHSATLYRKAHQLYIVARRDQEAYDHQSKVVEASLLEAARNALEKEKREGKLSKAPTKDMVEMRARVSFEDEYRAIDDRNITLRKMVEELKHLVDVFKKRHTALETMTSNRAENL